ncbi:protein of unknown function [Prevotella sp. KH2C16]|nr:protein of unknown function [Prevotella sp. KH2C16]
MVVFLLSLTCQAKADNTPTANERWDSVEISLLTCGPGQEIWSLYGHTAIRVHDKYGEDIVVNYGIFSFRQKFFILRFVFGLTDYQMGITTYPEFIAEYRQEGRWVKQQVLNLTREDKFRIVEAIEKNYLPENREYRYNYFYDNCTTRARDMLIRNTNEKISYPESQEVKKSFRDMIHAYNSDHPWARLGNDLLLGLKADFNTTKDEQQFLPENLMSDFDNATLTTTDGKKIKLVGNTKYLLHAEDRDSRSGFPLSPSDCSIILLIITIAVCVFEWSRKKILWGYDALLLILDGIAGLILFAMVFSQHPTVSLNLQILLLCPLSLVFVTPVVKKLRRRQLHWYLTLFKYLIAIAVIGYAFQKYDEAVLILALILLGRIVSNEILITKHIGNTDKNE